MLCILFAPPPRYLTTVGELSCAVVLVIFHIFSTTREAVDCFEQPLYSYKDVLQQEICPWSRPIKSKGKHLILTKRIHRRIFLHILFFLTAGAVCACRYFMLRSGVQNLALRGAFLIQCHHAHSKQWQRGGPI